MGTIHEPGHTVNAFYDFMISVIEQNFSKKKYRQHCNFPKNAWYDDDCKKLKATIRETNHDINTTAGRLQQALLQREYKRLIQRKKRAHHRIIISELEELKSKDPQVYWRYWKKMKQNKNANDCIDVEKFTEYYKDLETRMVKEHLDNPFMNAIKTFMQDKSCHTEIPDGAMNDILNAPISEEEIKVALKGLKNNKATGIDTIPSEFYKYGSESLLQPLQLLFNAVFQSGEYPPVWCQGTINPLHKQCSKSLPENYRKITILSALGKIFEIILNNRLRYYKCVLKLDDPCQNGFKQRQRSTDNAFLLNAVIDKCAASKRPLYVCFVDFKAAFDRVNQTALLYKMYKKGIKGRFLDLISSMFSNAQCRVKWNQKIGQLVKNLVGVLQGGVLSPSLFTLFIDDLKEYLDPKNGVTLGDAIIYYLLFADDLILMSETSAGLQSLIDGLEQFCKQWQVEVNLIKTKYMVFHKKYITCRDVATFTYNKNPVEETDSYKYVGTLFTNKRDRFRQDHVVKRDKALKALYAAKKYIRETVGKEFPINMYMKMFDTQIRPILDFGCEVWFTGKESRDLEIVHTDFLKQMLGVKRQTPNLAVYGETGRFPLLLKQQELALKYWLRLLTLDKTNPLYIAYQEMLDLDTKGYSTWCTNIRISLTEINCKHIWDKYTGAVTTELGDVSSEFKHIKDSMYALYRDQWANKISDTTCNPKLRTYCLFKSIHHREPYLTKIRNKTYAKHLCKFRVSSHRLAIETGRYNNVPENERLCIYCHDKCVDNEIHLLTKCTFHSEERKVLYNCASQFITGFSERDTDRAIFMHIMTSNSAPMVNCLGRYLYKCCKKRGI